MKKFNIIFLLSVSLFLSCEKIVDIDLSSTDSKIVIEGSITDQAGPYTVRISKSTDFFVPEKAPTISDATVIISDNEGNSEILNEVSAGVYETASLQGTYGRTYTLRIDIEGEIYTASSVLNHKTLIDSLSFEEKSAFGPADEGDEQQYRISCFFQDIAGVEEYYRLKVYNNNTLQTAFYVQDDKLTDGQLIEYGRIDGDIFKGDSVKVELLRIDKGVYDYYKTLANILGGGGMQSSSTPANPISNISNGAMGYFGALSISSAEITID